MLVKVARLLNTCSLSNGKPHFTTMKKLYRDDIVRRLSGVCRWLLEFSGRLRKVGFKRLQDSELGILASDVLPAQPVKRLCKPYPAFHRPENPQGKDQLEADLDEDWQQKSAPMLRARYQRFYLAPTIWYVLSQIPEAFEGVLAKEHLWHHLEDIATIKNEDNRNGAVASDDPHACLIRWYHSFSAQSICAELDREDADRLSKMNINRKNIAENCETWQVKAEKSLRLFEYGRYGQRHLGHEPANLAMVGRELGIANQPLAQQKKSCLQLVKHLVADRKPTQTLNPGRSAIVRWDPKHDIRSAKPRPAPWELSCLAQHLPISLGLTVATKERKRCLENCKEFLLSDYTFMASWDSSKTTTVGQWWDFITSSIISTELVDRILDPDAATPGERALEARSDRKIPIYLMARISVGTRLTLLTQTADDLDLNIKVTKIYELLERNHKKSKHRFGFDWRFPRPKPLYHADNIVQSLDDTPDIFKLKHTLNIPLRSNIVKYREHNAVHDEDWSLDNIKQSVGPSKLHHISCFDFALMVDANNLPEISKPILHGRADEDFWKNWKSTDLMGSEQLMRLLQWEPSPGKTSSIMDLYLLGKLADHPEFSQNFDQQEKYILNDPVLRGRLLQDYQESLSTVLNDSVSTPSRPMLIYIATRDTRLIKLELQLVDIGTKYRIL